MEHSETHHAMTHGKKSQLGFEGTETFHRVRVETWEGIVLCPPPYIVGWTMNMFGLVEVVDFKTSTGNL